MGDEAGEEVLYRDDLLRLERLQDPDGLRVVGEIDMSNSEGFSSALESARGRGRVIIDLSACEHLGSAAIGVLIETWQRSEGSLQLRLVDPPPTIRMALQVAGVDRFPGIDIVDGSAEGPA